jgi:hypothetical protein
MRGARLLARGRHLAEELMTDECVIGRTVPGEFDDVTGNYTPDRFEETYSGRCQFKSANTAVGEVTSESQLLVETGATLKLPVATSTGVLKDDEVTITASRTDPALPGTKARVEGPFVSSATTARRFRVEVTS